MFSCAANARLDMSEAERDITVTLHIKRTTATFMMPHNIFFSLCMLVKDHCCASSPASADGSAGGRRVFTLCFQGKFTLKMFLQQMLRKEISTDPDARTACVPLSMTLNPAQRKSIWIRTQVVMLYFHLFAFS